MTIYYNTIKLIFLSVLLMGVSCTSEDLTGDSTIIGQVAEISATIGSTLETKASLRGDDGISYATFASDDKIGFYSEGGLSAANQELTYKSTSFLSEALQWTDEDARNMFAYYPYIADETNINIWRDKVSDNISLEGFNDILTSTNAKVIKGTLVQLNFKHHFAMLVIQKGVGFNKQNLSTDISVTLNESVGKTASIKERKSILLKKDGTGGVKTLSTYKGPQYKSKDTWYAIVPVGNFEGGGKAEVESVTLCNDNGYEMTIPYDRKTLLSNTKYVVTVQLRNGVAVIEPEEIVRWTDERFEVEDAKGIGNDNFSEWLSSYNDPNAHDYTTFGLYDEQLDKWAFKLKEDIRPNAWTNSGGAAAVITTFSDILDGQGHTISGITLIGTGNNIGFFGTLSGTVQNLKLEDIKVEGKDYVGAIAGINTGTITNCQVKGFSVVVGKNSVGGLVGNNTGSVSDCTSSAMVSGTGSVNLLVGSGTAATNSISTGVVVNKK